MTVVPKPLLAANWKMNPVDGGAALDLVRGVLPVASTHIDRVEIALFPPFPWLLGVAEVLDKTGVKLGAQDCFWEMSGAYTGEVSPAMLKGWCDWVIVGHSERRAYLGETDDMVARKAGAALISDLSVIMCVGELDEHYVAGKGDEVVTTQVKAGLANCSADDSARLVIAYEPVWAIGTGLTASAGDASAIHTLLRSELRQMIGTRADEIPILYGGSVNPENAAGLLAAPEVDGLLVGGASVEASSWLTIAKISRTA